MDNKTFCCNVFKSMAVNESIGWYVYSDEEKNTETLLMPYIQSGDYQYRVNHCPSCGVHVRNMEIDSKVLKKLKEEV